jgi:UDP-N-acetylenolpyruvoylglucosamine reductase
MSANGAHHSLADHTTLRAGGPARELVFVESREHAVEVARRADRAGRPLLVLGGGSNALVGDGGFDGPVARKAARVCGSSNTRTTQSWSLQRRGSRGVPWSR